MEVGAAVKPGRLRRRPRRGRKPVEAIEHELWHRGHGPCVVCPAEGGKCEGRVQGHHIISKQALKKRGLHKYLWDRRNRLPVCQHRHEQHETKVKPIPRELLPQAALDFATELDLGWWLDRHYPC